MVPRLLQEDGHLFQVSDGGLQVTCQGGELGFFEEAGQLGGWPLAAAVAEAGQGRPLHQLGQIDEAIAHFRAALALHPGHADAPGNLGQALIRQGRRDEALSSLKEAVRLQPGHAVAHLNLANLCRDLGQLADAISSYRRVIQLRPEHAEARSQLALALARSGQDEEAISCLHDCLLFQPDSAETCNQLGFLLARRERLDEAAAAFRRVLRVQPGHPEGLNNLGNILLKQQKTEEAVALFREALASHPNFYPPHGNLGCALLQQNKPDEAVSCFQEAIRHNPGDSDAHCNLGNAFRVLGRHAEAVACYREALRLQPDAQVAALNLGVTLYEMGQLDEACSTLEELARKNPNYAPARNSLGVLRMHQGRPADSLPCFAEALRLVPEEAETHLNRALVYLLLGDYEAGWLEYEWRWKLKKTMPCPYPLPAWDGSPMPGKTVVLWSEQGLGDTLQFIRYAALVKERVGTVLLDCHDPLRGLLANSPGIDGLTTVGSAVGADAQAPLLSLPRLLGTSVATIPAPVPYLFPDPALKERWRARLAPERVFKVGIVWQGNPNFTGDRFRSVKLERFRPLAEVPGVRLFSIQKGEATGQIAQLSPPFPVTDLGGEISADFRDTAAALVNLDLLVSVDTSVAHLAGALGVPVWLLLPFNPDWRWLLGREDTPWYPSARLFRQEKWGDWDGVFARVASALRQRAREAVPREAVVSLPLAQGEEDVAPVVVGIRELRPEAQSIAEGGDCLGEFAESCEGDSPVIVDVGMFGRELDDLVEVGLGPVEVAQGLAAFREVVPDQRLGWVQLGRSPQDPGRVGVPPLAEGLHPRLPARLESLTACPLRFVSHDSPSSVSRTNRWHK